MNNYWIRKSFSNLIIQHERKILRLYQLVYAI